MTDLVKIVLGMLVIFAILSGLAKACNSYERRKQEEAHQAAMNSKEQEKQDGIAQADARAAKAEKSANESIKQIQSNADRLVQESKNEAEKKIGEAQQKLDARVLEVQQVERKRFDSMLAEVKSEKYSTYALFGGVVLLFLVLFFLLVFAITPLNSKMLISPSRYEVVAKEDAEILRFLKSYLVSQGKITEDHPLTRENCIEIITGK